MNSIMTRYVYTLAAMLTIAGCGGGGGGSPTAGIDRTGAPNPAAAALGTVTAFGSVVVNGVHYETSNAAFTIDGATGTQADLDIGDVVLVKGELDANDETRGSADTVEFDDIVEGPIALGSINATNEFNGTLIVLGQLVHVTLDDTSFDDSIQPASLDGLSDSLVIEVSGLVRSDGSITATRIEAKPLSTEFEITGIVSGVFDGVTRFNINALIVDFTDTPLIDNFPGGVIRNDDLVEVKGTSFGTGGELLADRVEFKGGLLAGEAGDHIEIEGFITRFADALDFDVSGLTVTTDGNTIYTGGIAPGNLPNATDLGLDIKVEVEGERNGDGVLLASKIDIRRSKAVRMLADVDSVAADGSSFVALGVTVNIDDMTRLEDKRSGSAGGSFAIDSLAGAYVEVRGVEFPAGSGEILAGILELEDADPDTILQGFVPSRVGATPPDPVPGDPSFLIFGVRITTNALTTEFFRGENTSIDATEFFDSLDSAAIPLLIKAKGTEMDPPEIVADEVQIQD